MVRISNTLAHTKRATFSVIVKDGPEQHPRPAGTGFFLNDDGLFATAAHVIKGRQPIVLFKEDDAGVNPSIDVEPTPVFFDAEADFALLRAKLDTGREDHYGKIASLRPSERPLEDGDPVYAFGYPLPEGGSVILTPEEMKGLLGEKAMALLPKLGPGKSFGIPAFALCPRTTSAVVASGIDYSFSLDIKNRNVERNFYVIDKALNPGNSGGPILTPETGYVHALCSAYQIHQAHQEDLGITIKIPSLYGFVTRLTHPTIRKALEAQGIGFETS